jgi:hypothetical protein
MRRLRHILLLVLSIISIAIGWNYFHALDQETGGLVSVLRRLGIYLGLLIGGVWIFACAIRNPSRSGRDTREKDKVD